MGNAVDTGENRNPPIDYVVAAWLGMPDREVARGLREGWIRAPAGVDARMWAEQRGFSEGEHVPEEEGVGPIAAPSPEEPAPPPLEDPTVRATRERIETLLRRVDPAMDGATFERAWDEAGPDDAARGANLSSFLATALNVAVEPAAEIDTQLAALEERASAYVGDARFLRIAGATSAELQSLGAGDASVRRALAEHSSWALAGDTALARAADATGRYDRFDRDTGEALLSDAWIADRAKHAAWRSAHDAASARGFEEEGWRFVDRAAGESMTTLTGAAAAEWRHQVIFARDEGDRIVGDAGTDRIHGGIGDDILRGRAGDDLLEGGRGDDVLQGGAGRDRLAGQQGSDELDGGAGNDDLAGGSGDDELTGGRGNDVLRGGDGADTYRFDEGDGHDTIDDDSGVIVIDDVELAGTMLRSAEGWLSADRRFTFALEGEGTGRALVVRRTSQEESGGESMAIRIASWNDGAFGIALGSEADDPGGDDIDLNRQTPAGSEAPLGANAWPHADAAYATHSSGSEAPLPPDTFDWLSSAPEDALAFVDMPRWSAALDAWASPPVPDVGSMSGDTLGVTSYDVGDAVAGIASDGDDLDGAAHVFFPTLAMPGSPSRRDDGPRSPPDLLLRTSP